MQLLEIKPICFHGLCNSYILLLLRYFGQGLDLIQNLNLCKLGINQKYGITQNLADTISYQGMQRVHKPAYLWDITFCTR
jgi:hypothetical protein